MNLKRQFAGPEKLFADYLLPPGYEGTDRSSEASDFETLRRQAFGNGCAYGFTVEQGGREQTYYFGDVLSVWEAADTYLGLFQDQVDFIRDHTDRGVTHLVHPRGYPALLDIDSGVTVLDAKDGKTVLWPLQPASPAALAKPGIFANS